MIVPFGIPTRKPHVVDVLSIQGVLLWMMCDVHPESATALQFAGVGTKLKILLQ